MKLAGGCGILLTRRETSTRRLLPATHPHIGHVQKAVHPFLPGIHLCPVSTAIHLLHECVAMAKGATRPLHLSLGVDRTLRYPNGTKPANLLPLLDSVFSYERLKNPLDGTSCNYCDRHRNAALFRSETISQNPFLLQAHSSRLLSLSCTRLTTTGIHTRSENEGRTTRSPFFWCRPPFETSSPLKDAYIIYQGKLTATYHLKQ
ncbi:hypothetical protein HPB51_025389 [Rhipicephalus microplus]|uniref:Uncharacterized protein n=1 Tax=Rhipicephalus microplus TaxID=6941 RepID=A0A9J6DDK6_RHIMP|nr:hypothetical protein HPB51_025389 [Rhipicephalus microplus]